MIKNTTFTIQSSNPFQTLRLLDTTIDRKETATIMSLKRNSNSEESKCYFKKKSSAKWNMHIIG